MLAAQNGRKPRKPSAKEKKIVFGVVAALLLIPILLLAASWSKKTTLVLVRLKKRIEQVTKCKSEVSSTFAHGRATATQ